LYCVFRSCYELLSCCLFFFFFQAEDGIRDFHVTGVQTCALPILTGSCMPTAATKVPSTVAAPHMSYFMSSMPPWVFRLMPPVSRSEERRVGKECRSRW